MGSHPDAHRPASQPAGDPAAPSRRRPRRWSGITLAGLIALLGSVGTCVFNQEQEATRVAEMEKQERQSLYTLITQREQYALDFRAKSFQMLLDKLLDQRQDVSGKIAILRHFSLNFPGRINARVFFDMLAHEIAKLPAKERPGVEADLMSLAAGISNAEQEEVEAAAKKRFPTVWLEVGKPTTVILQGDEFHKDLHEVTLRFHGVDTQEFPPSAAMDVSIVDEGDTVRTPVFGLSCFDTPAVDYTILPDGHRVSVVLKDAISRVGPPNQRVRVKVVQWPVHYVMDGDTPQGAEISEMVDELFATHRAHTSWWTDALRSLGLRGHDSEKQGN